MRSMTTERCLPSRDGENHAPFTYPGPRCVGGYGCKSCPRWLCTGCSKWRPWCVGNGDSDDCDKCWLAKQEGKAP